MSISNNKLFGTNGVRGIFGESLSIPFLIDLSYSIGTFFNHGPLVLGFDGRSSSFAISKIVSSVLMSMGIDVYNMGLTPTPCLQFTVKDSNFSGGIMITASHNPSEFNGLKPVSDNGMELSRSEEILIEDAYFNKKYLEIPDNGFGDLFCLGDALKKYIVKVFSLIDVESIKQHKFKIVMDMGNGMQSLVAPIMAKELNCEVLIINGDIDGEFSARGSEPKMENLSNLINFVKKSNADFGVAFDGDGDRSIFCDENGIIHWGDKTGPLLAYYLIKVKKLLTSVVCPINSSVVISKICKEIDAKVIFTKVGSIEVTQTMNHTGSKIGFEENGGFFYGLLNNVRDGAVTTALILEMLSYYKLHPLNVNSISKNRKDNDRITLSKLYEFIDTTFQHKSSIKLSNLNDYSNILNLCRNHGSIKKIEEIDGIKIWFDDDSWIMFRPSGTEPLLRIYAESDDKYLLDSKVREYTELIRKSL
ncbi:MAG TPA: phosphoglucosamine mutase [Candidatus Nitrosocosmicus sp.]